MNTPKSPRPRCRGRRSARHITVPLYMQQKREMLAELGCQLFTVRLRPTSGMISTVSRWTFILMFLFVEARGKSRRGFMQRQVCFLSSLVACSVATPYFIHFHDCDQLTAAKLQRWVHTCASIDALSFSTRVFSSKMSRVDKASLANEVSRAEAREAREARLAGLEPPSCHLVSTAHIVESRGRVLE